MDQDTLTTILKVSQFTSKVICNPTLSMNWGLDFPSESHAMFHIITKGACWLKHSSKSEPIKLTQGDIVFIPQTGHQLLSSPDEETMHFIEGTDRAKKRISEGFYDLNQTTTFFCGMYKMEEEVLRPFFSMLPSYIHINTHGITSNLQLQQITQLIQTELQFNQLGASIMLESLIDILLVAVIRSWLESNNSSQTGWIFALKDPKIGEAINLMHRSPEIKWTVERLAQSVFMSRASFAKKFSHFVGESPMIHLTKWRMDYSARLLRTTNISISDVATSSGYESETSFSKAFKKYLNMPPVSYRIEHRA